MNKQKDVLDYTSVENEVTATKNLPNEVAFSTTSLITQNISPIYATNAMPMEDNANDLITQDTLTRRWGLLSYHSPSSSSCDLIELSSDLAKKKIRKTGSKNKQQTTSTTTNPAPHKKTAISVKKCTYSPVSSEDYTEIKELRKRLKNKSAKLKDEALTKSLQKSESYHIFCDMEASLQSNIYNDDISSIDCEKSVSTSHDSSSINNK